MTYRFPLTLFFAALLAACVTVNVYFPESAAERAADLFIKDVYGEDANRAAPPTSDGEPQSLRDVVPFNTMKQLISWVGNLVIPAAHAQAPDINIETPAINALKTAMAQRHLQLKPGYDSGAVGMAANGLIVLRDPKLVDLKQRNQIKQLVAGENRDRNQLYIEVAKANSHAEWEKDIRSIFAQRWVGNAPSGWWYEQSGQWQQK